MSAQSIVCGACGAAVPYGRLSCPECGELLASVVGGARRMTTGAAAGGTSVATLLADVAPDTGAELPEATLADLPEVDPDGLPESTAGLEALSASVDDAPDAPSVPAAAFPSVLHDAEPAGRTAAAAWSDPMPSWDASGAREAEAAPSTSVFGAMPAGPFAAAAAMAAPTPGAYVPPMPAVILPAGPAAPARAWGKEDLPEPGGTAGGPGRAALAIGAVGAIERPRLVDATRWLAVAGAALAVAGFVLPWATSVIGAGGLGYFDRWGLAGSGHLLLAVALLAVLAMALIKNPLPVWLRVGVPGLGLGALLLGLTWPYVFSSVLGPQLGVYAVAVGAVLLMVAGVVAIWSDRHETETRPV
jgi:hypothetical protein